MKKLILLALLIGVCDKDSSSLVETTDSDNKTDALNFSLQIIESIIDQDVATFKTFFLDSLWTMDGDGQFSLSDGIIEEIFSGILSNSAIDANTTMDDYHTNYTPNIYTFDEFNNYALEVWSETFPQYTWITSNDFIFFGHLKENGIEIIWDDMNLFLVTKIDNKWWFKAASG